MVHRPDLSMPDPLRAMLRPGNVLAGSLSGSPGSTIGGLIAGRGQVDRSRREGSMTIRTRLTRRMVLTGAAATALVIGVGTAALAVNATWTVKPGGAISFSGNGQVKDV